MTVEDLGGPPKGVTPAILACVAGLVLPVLLIPVIAFTGSSEWVEELAKAAVVLFLVLAVPGRTRQLATGTAFGFLFGLSENALYLNQVFQAGTVSTFWERFAWTLPMHLLTAALLTVSGLWGKKFLPFGFAAALGLHLLFNRLAV